MVEAQVDHSSDRALRGGQTGIVDRKKAACQDDESNSKRTPTASNEFAQFLPRLFGSIAEVAMNSVRNMPSTVSTEC